MLFLPAAIAALFSVLWRSGKRRSVPLLALPASLLILCMITRTAIGHTGRPMRAERKKWILSWRFRAPVRATDGRPRRLSRSIRGDCGRDSRRQRFHASVRQLVQS